MILEQHLTMQKIFCDDRGRQHWLLNKTAAMQSKTGNRRRTAGSIIKQNIQTYFLKLNCLCMCLQLIFSIHYLSQGFYWRFLTVLCGPATNSQSFNTSTNSLHWLTKTLFMEGDIYRSKVGLIVSYSTEKLFLKLGYHQ